MKKAIYVAAVVLFGVNVSYAGETALDSLRAAVSPSVFSGLVMPGTDKGYVTGNGFSAGAAAKPVEWITINGGKFTMGTDSGEQGFEDAKPIREVAIKTFDMSKTAVTVEQYAECVFKGHCTEPKTGDYCNWGVAGRKLHPVNCVSWDQAYEYARFKGGRLPSESEWEYAATSGGKNQKYPWGNEEPTCDKAVMFGNGGYGCGKTARCRSVQSLPATPRRACAIWQAMSCSGCRTDTRIRMKARLLTAVRFTVRASPGCCGAVASSVRAPGYCGTSAAAATPLNTTTAMSGSALRGRMAIKE